MKEKKMGGRLAVVLGALTAAAAAGAAVGAVLLHRKKENIHISESDLADTLPIPPEESGAESGEETDDVCGCFDEEAKADPAPDGEVTPEEEEKLCEPEE